jgi:hypothetical protein
MTKIRGDRAAGGAAKADDAGSARAGRAGEDAPSLDDVADAQRPGPAATLERSSSADAQGAIHLIEDKLSGFVSDADARACVDALRGLPGGDCALVWKAMGADSQRELIDNVDDSARGALLDALERAGVVERAPVAAHPLTTGLSDALLADPWGEPPAAPRLHAPGDGLSTSLREAVRDNNVERARAYRAAYDAYLDDYKAKVVVPAGEGDVAAIRAAGPPAPMLLPAREPGAPPGASSRDEVERADDWRKVADGAAALVDIYGPITRAVHHARGEMVAGELRFSLGAEAEILGVGLGVSRDYGQDGDGKLTVKAGGGPFFGEPGEDGGEKATFTAGAVSVGIEVDSAGNRELTEVGASAGAFGVGADLKKGTAKVEVGISHGLKSSYGGDDLGVEVAAKVSAEFKPFLAPEEVEGVFYRGGGFFDAPPELGAGKRWDELSDERRAHLHRLGWSKAEWAAQRKRKATLDVPRLLG